MDGEYFDVALKKLSSAQIAASLTRLQGWKLHDGKLEKKIEFKDFDNAIRFIVKLAPIANSLDHHPDIYNSYNQVVLDLYTHEAGGITAKDLELAQRIDLLMGSF